MGFNDNKKESVEENVEEVSVLETVIEEKVPETEKIKINIKVIGILPL